MEAGTDVVHIDDVQVQGVHTIVPIAMEEKPHILGPPQLSRRTQRSTTAFFMDDGMVSGFFGNPNVLLSSSLFLFQKEQTKTFDLFASPRDPSSDLTPATHAKAASFIMFNSATASRQH